MWTVIAVSLAFLVSTCVVIYVNRPVALTDDTRFDEVETFGSLE